MAAQAKIDFIRDVALRMDEVSSADDVTVGVGIEDNNPLYTLIEGLIDEAFGEVARVAPIQMLTLTSIDATGSNGVTTIPVPKDYLRFAFITGAFDRTITMLNIEGDPVALRQNNVNTRAGDAKPVAVFSGASGTPTGTPAIKVYSKTTTGITMYYVPKESHIINNNVSYSSVAESEIAKWITAEKVFSAMGDPNRAQLSRARADALMQ